MKIQYKLLFTISVLMGAPLYTHANNEKSYSLTLTVNGLQNSNGIVQFSIYNKDGTIPDEGYEKFYRKKTNVIVGNSSIIVFHDLPKGIYAVNILHDENSNGKLDKGFILPIEGIGFSNYDSIGFSNRPNFSDASFKLNANININIKIIYM